MKAEFILTIFLSVNLLKVDKDLDKLSDSVLLLFLNDIGVKLEA